MGVYTGTVPTFLAGELPDADKFTEISNFMTAAATAWTTWSPTLTNLTLGNGTTSARYRQLGKTIDYRFKFVLGSTSAVGTLPNFTLPAAQHSQYIDNVDHIGDTTHTNSGTAQYRGIVVLITGNKGQISSYGTTGLEITTTATVPFTWGTADSIECWGTYEAA